MFATRARKFSFVLLLAASALSFQGKAATIFQDSFESGRLDHIQNGASWGGANAGPGESVQVTKDMARGTGANSLKFTFLSGPDGDDAWAEQRFKPGKQYKDVWFQFDLFVPSNYYHRSQSPSNNKFMAIYAAPYPAAFHILLQIVANGSGGSNIGWHDHVVNDTYPSSGRDFIGSADRGKWMTVKVRIKAPSATGVKDGIVQVWKNNVQVLDVSTATAGSGSSNYIDEMYLLGWANSGFNETTSLYIDNFIFSDTPIGTKIPASPTSLIVQ